MGFYKRRDYSYWGEGILGRIYGIGENSEINGVFEFWSFGYYDLKWKYRIKKWF